jgi:hypothetical protein
MAVWGILVREGPYGPVRQAAPSSGVTAEHPPNSMVAISRRTRRRYAQLPRAVRIERGVPCEWCP